MKQSATPPAGPSEPTPVIVEYPPVHDIAQTTTLRTTFAPANKTLPPRALVHVQFGTFLFSRGFTAAACRQLAAQLILTADRTDAAMREGQQT